MEKTIDTSKLLYRMGKYSEINIGRESHDSFMHFMHLLTRTIENMPNAALTHKNPICVVDYYISDNKKDV